jgi:hypothetical protein
MWAAKLALDPDRGTPRRQEAKKRQTNRIDHEGHEGTRRNTKKHEETRRNTKKTRALRVQLWMGPAYSQAAKDAEERRDGQTVFFVFLRVLRGE